MATNEAPVKIIPLPDIIVSRVLSFIFPKCYDPQCSYVHEGQFSEILDSDAVFWWCPRHSFKWKIDMDVIQAANPLYIRISNWMWNSGNPIYLTIRTLYTMADKVVFKSWGEFYFGRLKEEFRPYTTEQMKEYILDKSHEHYYFYRDRIDVMITATVTSPIKSFHDTN